MSHWKQLVRSSLCSLMKRTLDVYQTVLIDFTEQIRIIRTERERLLKIESNPRAVAFDLTFSIQSIDTYHVLFVVTGRFFDNHHGFVF